MAKRNEVSAARLAAFEVLEQIEEGAFSSVALAAKEPELGVLDRALCHELVLGVLRWRLQLDAIIDHFSRRKIESLDPAVRQALRLGLYQLRFLSKIPESAAVNESVNLVGRARLTSARAFVNGVLRSAARKPQYSPSTSVSDPFDRLAVETSHPRWLIERWAAAFGIEETESLARANNEPPPLAIRIVAQPGEENTVLDKLRGAGATLIPSKITKHAWRVSGATALVRQLVEHGEIYIQDEASQLVAQTVNAQPGELILDLCAAPGGKTTLIANNTPDASVIASDISARRLTTVSSNVALHRLRTVSLVITDAAGELPFSSAVFDRVLVDAPCSGTGTLRHNPEIRWRLKQADIQELATQQRQFLTNVARVVKSGGLLVYSTCSVECEENEAVVAEFLAANEGFHQIAVSVGPELLTNSGAARTWPQRDDTDGFFIAMFRRN